MAFQINGNGSPIFTDLDPNMTRNPKTGDLMLLKNDSAIKTSLSNLMSTMFGERLFQPTIGGSLKPLLFEPIDAITALEIQDRILRTIVNHEPRVNDVIVDVSSKPDDNSYYVTVEYSVRSVGRTDRLTFVLERIR